MNLLQRIANYFKEWDGVDETAPKMELDINDLRYIAAMNTERCRLLAEKRRCAKWEDRYGDGDWHCSRCGAIVEKDEQHRHNWYRCYNCGAKMEIQTNDENEEKQYEEMLCYLYL